MKRKRRILVLLFLSLLFLAGWGKKQVELLNDKKLIDLSAALGNCILGAEDLIPDEGDSTQDNMATPAPKPTEKITPVPTVTPKVTVTPTAASKPTLPLKPRFLEIRIRDQEVIYNYVPWADLTILKEQLRRDHNDRVSFRLIDDYAEAHTYRQMLKLLEDLKNEIGLNYTWDWEEAR